MTGQRGERIVSNRARRDLYRLGRLAIKQREEQIRREREEMGEDAWFASLEEEPTP